MSVRPASTTPAPSAIAISIRFDGRVRLELLADGYSLLEIAEADADAREEIVAVIVRWASDEVGPVRRRGAAWAALGTDYGRAYLVEVSSRVSGRLHQFSSDAEGLSARFAQVFARPTGATPDAARKEAGWFADGLARDIGSFLRLSRERAAVRLAHGAYLGILQRYADDLRGITSKEDQGSYDGLQRTIGRIVEDEAYLRLAEDEAARTVYATILDQLEELYQWDMQLAKGGHAMRRR